MQEKLGRTSSFTAFDTFASEDALERYFAASSNNGDGLDSVMLSEPRERLGGGGRQRPSSSCLQQRSTQI